LNSVALCAVGVPHVSGQAIFMVRIGSIRSLDGLIPYFAANRPGRLNAFPSVPSMGRFLLDERSGDEGQHARASLSAVGSASPRRALQARMPTPLGPHGKGRRGRLGARSLSHLVVRASNSPSICRSQGIVAEIEGIAEAHRRHVATALWWRSSKPKPGISGAVSRVHARRRIRPAGREGV
jgi:hypothetical protein